MIQRIQTLWLFISSLLSATLLIDWYTGYVYKGDIPKGITTIVQYLRISDHLPSLLIASAMIILPLVAIFYFKNRSRQKSLTLLSILLVVGFIAVSIMHIENFKNSAPAPLHGSYQPGIVVAVGVLVLLVFAFNGIRKDDQLVKSMDRLR
ncbi:MAG TPA: DUF4293 domain-containing protein [Flavipsychrobacter sp.]|jgi:amino acid permease|nr:DUF4293 domain-containing protein [Flavipsychrobacter sp.]